MPEADGYDLIEWLAQQAWSTERVGMMGSSAAAISCYITALTKPPHLLAMAANMHPDHSILYRVEALD